MEPKKLLTAFAFVLVVLFSGCKKDTFVEKAGLCPLVVSTDPANLATGVPLNKIITATFNEIMNPVTITTTSFTIETAAKGASVVTGVVSCEGEIATFTPSSALLPNTTYTGTIKTAAKDMNGNALKSNYVWTFTTSQSFTLTIIAVNGTVGKNPDQLTYNNGSTVQLTANPAAGYLFTSWSGDATGSVNPLTVTMNANKNITANFTVLSVCTPPVDLGLSGNYVILAETGISTTATAGTSITGNMGISPAAASLITGFNLVLPAGGAYSSSTLVTGNIYAPGYADPTPADLTTSTTNMSTAFTTGNGLAPTVTELLAGNLNSQTLAPGVYKWSTGLLITTGITLDGGGDPCASWVFQVAQDLTVANGAIITLANGANAKNIFWVVAGSKADIGTTVDFSGNILCKNLISLNTGAKVTGRLMAQTAVTLDGNIVILP